MWQDCDHSLVSQRHILVVVILEIYYVSCGKLHPEQTQGDGSGLAERVHTYTVKRRRKRIFFYDSVSCQAIPFWGVEEWLNFNQTSQVKPQTEELKWDFTEGKIFRWQMQRG